MENLSVEIQVLHAHFISFSFRRLRDLLVPEDLSQRCHVPRRLIAIVVLSTPVKDAEEVVVCTGNELPVVELKSRTITLNTEQRHFVCSLILYSHLGLVQSNQNTHTHAEEHGTLNFEHEALCR